MVKNKRHIILQIPTNISRLSGKDYGKHIYQSQVEKALEQTLFNQEVPVIVFPAHIGGVSIEFVKGFCQDLLYKFSKHEVIRQVDFLSMNFYGGKVVEQSIRDSILF